jgi:hypothetical protein
MRYSLGSGLKGSQKLHLFEVESGLPAKETAAVQANGLYVRVAVVSFRWEKAVVLTTLTLSGDTLGLSN